MKTIYKVKPYFDQFIVYGTGESAWNSDSVLVLNDAGYFIFSMLEKDASVSEIVDALILEYEVSHQTAREDTKEFIEILKTKNIY